MRGVRRVEEESFPVRHTGKGSVAELSSIASPQPSGFRKHSESAQIRITCVIQTKRSIKTFEESVRQSGAFRALRIADGGLKNARYREQERDAMEKGMAGKYGEGLRREKTLIGALRKSLLNR